MWESVMTAQRIAVADNRRRGRMPAGAEYKWGYKKMSRRTRQGLNPKLILLIIVVIVVAVVAVVGVFLARRYAPGKDQVDLNEYYELTGDDAMYIVVNDEQADENGFLDGEEPYLPIHVVQTMINGRFYWDGTEKILRYVTADSVVSCAAETDVYKVGKAQKNAKHTIVTVRNNNAYLSWSFLLQFTNARQETFTAPNRIVVSTQFGEITSNKVKGDTQLRVRGGIKSEIVDELERGELVHVLEETGDWSKVVTADGMIGYMRSSRIGKTEVTMVDSAYEEKEHPHIHRDGKIGLLWHQVTNQSANSSINDILSKAKGINVVSPTWFYLDDDNGGIASIASHDYVDACHKKNVEVWGLVSNVENAKVNTAKVLTVTSHRDKLINNLISEAIQYNLDGINVDFESLKQEVGYGFIEFIRELSIKCANNGLILSVDNYPPSSYTGLYYRTEQAAFADYVILMAYDEHFSGSEEAGSVASLGYVQQSVSDTLKEVPASSLILGMPFYTRLWQTTGDKLTSSNYGMKEAEDLLEEKAVEKTWDDAASQYHASWKDEKSEYEIWLEEDRSLEEKCKVMQTNKLAGAAFWKYGYQKDSIWTLIAKYTKD